MYYIFNAEKLGGDLAAPMLVIFNRDDKAEVRAFVKFAKHPGFAIKHTGSGVVPLPPTSFDKTSMEYIVVRAGKDGAVYITDAVSPGFMLKAARYNKLPKGYSVPWTEDKKV